LNNSVDTHNGLAGLNDLEAHGHACFIYDTPEQRLTAAVRCVREAIRRHERVVYMCNEEMRRETLVALRQAGYGPDHLESEQLVFITQRTPFCEDGLFTAHAMIEFLNAEIERAIADGFSGLRGFYEMTWVLGNELETMRVLECESRLNETLPRAPAVMVCQWRRDAFEPLILLEALHTHPLVMVGDEVLDNSPYYIPPAEYLASRSANEQLDRQLSVLRRLNATRRLGLTAEAAPRA
jgi:hypothetical protein